MLPRTLVSRGAVALALGLAGCGQVVAVDPGPDGPPPGPDAAVALDGPGAPDGPAASPDATIDGPTEAALTLTIDGPGRVFVSPANLECATTCTVAIPASAAVKLTANPAAGAVFDAWTAPGCGTDPTCEFTMTGPVAAGARFKPLP